MTGIWSYELLRRSPSWHPWIAYALLAAAAVAVVGLLLPAGTVARSALVGAISTGIVLGGGSVAYALNTAATPQTGSTPSAGPTVAGSGFGGGGFGGAGGPGGGFGGGSGSSSGGLGGGFGGGSGTGGPPTQNGSSGTTGTGSTGTGSNGTGSTGTGEQAGRPTGGFGGAGGAGGGQTANSALTALLKATSTKWAAATVGSQSAAPLELASGKAVMAIGGFTGSDPSITLAAFEKLVAAGEIRYFIAGGQGGGPGGGSGTSSVTSWVESHFSSTTVGGTTVYDLTKATS